MIHADASPVRLPTGARVWLLNGSGLDAETLGALLDRPAAEVLKDDRRSTVWRVEHGERCFVVKRYRDRPWRRWLYSRVRRSIAWREWYAAATVHRLGLRVCRPIALVHPPGGDELLVLPFMDAPTLARLAVEDTEVGLVARSQEHHARRRRIARAVGRQIGTLTAAGYVNRDTKPSNMLIDPECEAGKVLEKRPGAGALPGRLPGAGEPWLIDVTLRWRRNDRQVARLLCVLLRSLSGPVTSRERAACLRALLRADPSLRPRRRWLIQQVHARLTAYHARL